MAESIARRVPISYNVPMYTKEAKKIEQKCDYDYLELVKLMMHCGDSLLIQKES